MLCCYLVVSCVCEAQEQLDQDVLTVFYPDRGGGDRAILPPSSTGRPH